MATHYMSNVLTGYTLTHVFSGSEKSTYYILFVAFGCLAALAILWKSRSTLGYQDPKPQPLDVFYKTS